MTGIHRVIRNEEQRQSFIQAAQVQPLPFAGKLQEPASPKTLKQIRYAHSLCNALAAYAQCAPEVAKKDAKVEFGVTIVCTSVVTGDRSARLKSFADYNKLEMVGFLSAMEVFLVERDIPFEAAEEK